MTIPRCLPLSPLLVLLILLVVPILGCSDSVAPASENSEPAQTTTAHSHATPGETCFICDPAKRDPDRLWCKGHGRYEDRCFLCHPEIRDEDRLYCTEHFLYEDECFLCHPELRESTETERTEPQAKDSADEIARVSTAAATSDLPEGLFCREHQVYERECGICHPELIANLAAGEGLKVRLPSPESAHKAGVRMGYAHESPQTYGVQALGELSYNRNKLAVVTPLADGVLREVLADVGDVVEEGQLLGEINSPAVANAKSALVRALVEVERARQAYSREEGLRERNISSERDYEEAQADYAAASSEVDRARQQLLNLGLSESEVESVEESRSTSSVLPLRAPFAGTIVEREAVQGTAVHTGAPLFHVADLDVMWMNLSVPETEALRLHPGVEVAVTFDALPGESFDGELTWVSANIDDSTRTVMARASIPNPDRRLKSGLFGTATITESMAPKGLFVPSDAVQIIDGQPVVFAKLDRDLYETRVVRKGAVVGDQVIVLEGITPLEEIAVAQSYILKSELLKARLGAGCVHE